MKNQFIIVSTLILSLTILNACKKKDETPSPIAAAPSVSFTIDGDGFVSKEVSITGISDLSNVGLYFSKFGFTSCTVGDKASLAEDDKNRAAFYFDGNTSSPTSQSVGTRFSNPQGPQELVNFLLSVTRQGTMNTYVIDYNDLSNTPGFISISKYGAVGSTIEGTFSGTLINSVTGEKVEITKGHFTVPRKKDI
ncbi:hypothetical protein [Chryseolinea soli]|uniref:Uncharacterized protein n=1 Tax=Chryseolinea soli TaxID=2321403 RepID=A0A385SVL6_9BACT|nr:hypothetical protein [Chryseolinea soli]AYB34586.1 hypothetical protein D4L85_30150 [Chryseolinea soli]